LAHLVGSNPAVWSSNLSTRTQCPVG